MHCFTPWLTVAPASWCGVVARRSLWKSKVSAGEHALTHHAPTRRHRRKARQRERRRYSLLRSRPIPLPACFSLLLTASPALVASLSLSLPSSLPLSLSATLCSSPSRPWTMIATEPLKSLSAFLSSFLFPSSTLHAPAPRTTIELSFSLFPSSRRFLVFPAAPSSPFLSATGSARHPDVTPSTSRSYRMPQTTYRNRHCSGYQSISRLEHRSLCAGKYETRKANGIYLTQPS